MNNLSLGSIAAVFIALIALATAIFHTSDPAVSASLANLQSQVANLNTHAGALAGPEIPSPYLQWGGVNRWAYQVQINQATSTLCAIQAPNATSTLKSYSVLVNSTAPYTQTFMLGYSTTKNATTTGIISSYTLGSSVQAALNATTTVTALTGINVDGVISPNAWLNFNVSTTTVGSATGPTATGQCEATFEQL